MRNEGWREGDEDISEDRTGGTLEDSKHPQALSVPQENGRKCVDLEPSLQKYM